MEVFADNNVSDPKGILNVYPRKYLEDGGRNPKKKVVEDTVEIGFHIRQEIPSGQKLNLIPFQSLGTLSIVSGTEWALTEHKSVG